MPRCRRSIACARASIVVNCEPPRPHPHIHTSPHHRVSGVARFPAAVQRESPYLRGTHGCFTQYTLHHPHAALLDSFKQTSLGLCVVGYEPTSLAIITARSRSHCVQRLRTVQLAVLRARVVELRLQHGERRTGNSTGC